jgi:hypothetical protein
MTKLLGYGCRVMESKASALGVAMESKASALGVWVSSDGVQSFSFRGSDGVQSFSFRGSDGVQSFSFRGSDGVQSFSFRGLVVFAKAKALDSKIKITTYLGLPLLLSLIPKLYSIFVVLAFF